MYFVFVYSTNVRALPYSRPIVVRKPYLIPEISFAEIFERKKQKTTVGILSANARIRRI
jgi:hypothetical protein